MKARTEDKNGVRTGSYGKLIDDIRSIRIPKKLPLRIKIVNNGKPEMIKVKIRRIIEVKDLPDLREIARSQGKSARTESGMAEGEVAIATSREDRPLSAEISWPGDGGASRKSGLQPTAPTPQSRPAENRAQTFEIKITLPALPKLDYFIKFKRTLSKYPKATRAIGLIGIIIVVLLIGLNLTGKGVQKTTIDTRQKSTGPQQETPDFPTLLPAGKGSDTLGGWMRISPPGAEPVYAYIDRIDDVQINVSQQQLPKSFTTKTAERVAELASDFNAGEKFTASGTTVYIGTSSDGVQSVIFSKNNLLILIKSASRLSTNQWSAYVNSLQPG